MRSPYATEAPAVRTGPLTVGDVRARQAGTAEAHQLQDLLAQRRELQVVTAATFRRFEPFIRQAMIARAEAQAAANWDRYLPPGIRNGGKR